MSKTTHPYFKQRILELVELGYTTPDIYSMLEETAPDELKDWIPDPRTIRRYVNAYRKADRQDWKSPIAKIQRTPELCLTLSRPFSTLRFSLHRSKQSPKCQQISPIWSFGLRRPPPLWICVLLPNSLFGYCKITTRTT